VSNKLDEVWGATAQKAPRQNQFGAGSGRPVIDQQKFSHALDDLSLGEGPADSAPDPESGHGDHGDAAGANPPAADATTRRPGLLRRLFGWLLAR
jgi:hypothetical protein